MEGTVIRALEEGLPLEKEPFRIIAEGLGIPEKELISVTEKLKEQRIIRQISPIYNTKMLGYRSSLVAFKVASETIEDAASAINSHPGVSHNYQRDCDFNLWFTIAIPPDSSLGLKVTVDVLAEKAGVKDYILLESKRVFKIGVKLGHGGMPNDKEEIEEVELAYKPLTGEEKNIVRVTQNHIPLVTRPFAVYADILGMDEDILIGKLKEFKKQGVIRRFAAVLYHRRIGFLANGMVVWNVPVERIGEAGYKIASYRAVSHCYERATNGVWRYNLFSMIHGKKGEDVDNIVRHISEETGLKDYAILYSSKEFKKVRPKYFTEDYYLWEANSGSG
jgi:DNA-binding Lrp family transcriptional regulator